MKYVIAAFLCAIVSLAHAAELTLFDIPLRTSSREAIRQAITQAGGRLTSSKRDTDIYDTRQIGLPGARSLEVIYLADKFVLAQYVLGEDSKSDERLRKMIVAKYGNPAGSSDFGREFIGDGKYNWTFDQDMQLVYTKEFFGARYLTYVNRAQQRRLEQLVNDHDRRETEKETKKLNKVF